MEDGRLAPPLFIAMLSALACEPPPPERVWIPDEEFTATLEVGVGDQGEEEWEVGEWISLHANRSTGPWVQVNFDSLPDGAPWMRRPPSRQEYGVESNVRWFVEPSGAATFNIPGPEDLRSRKVKFSQPGRYGVQAESHTWGGGKVESNVVEILIVDR